MILHKIDTDDSQLQVILAYIIYTSWIPVGEGATSEQTSRFVQFKLKPYIHWYATLCPYTNFTLDHTLSLSYFNQSLSHHTKSVKKSLYSIITNAYSTYKTKINIPIQYKSLTDAHLTVLSRSG